jgi:hypothetical protein
LAWPRTWVACCSLLLQPLHHLAVFYHKLTICNVQEDGEARPALECFITLATRTHNMQHLAFNRRKVHTAMKKLRIIVTMVWRGVTENGP